MGKSIKIAVSSDVLAAEYRAGASLKDIATKYGCSPQNVHVRLINAGVARRALGITKKSRPLDPIQCPTCGKLFKPHNRKQRFCSQVCIRRKGVCKHGHVLTEDTRYHFPSSQSRCRECVRMNAAARRHTRQKGGDVE